MIYEPTVSYYKTKYKLQEIEVLGLMVGARGTIPGFFVNTWPYNAIAQWTPNIFLNNMCQAMS